MLLGATGTGKTHAIRTLIDAGLKVAAIFTEPGMEVIADIPCERGMHFHYIAPSSPDWTSMVDSATKINQMSFEALTKMGDINKRQYTEFIDLLNTSANFKCDRCGQTFGAVDRLDPREWAFVVDSLSGLNVMAMNLVTGSKPVKSMNDWGVAMDNLERFITKMTTDIRCTAVLVAHMEREYDEISGGVSLMASTLGKKLAPRLPRFFSDVIMCKREGTKFSWSTAGVNIDLKARNVPIADNLQPDFRPILDSWKKRAGVVSVL
jgi:hypothetical protein